MEGLNNNINKISEAKDQILAMRQEMAVMGANNFEYSALDELIRKMEEGIFAPEKAIEQARAIRDSKQAYH